MNDHVVVSFDWAAEFGARASVLRLAKLAEALGASLSAFSPSHLSVAFVEAEEEEAVHFAARAARKCISEGAAVRCAVARGKLDSVFEPGAFVALSQGEALDVAAQLIGLISVGQVIIDRKLTAFRAGDLSGVPADASDSARAGLLLDIAHPFVRDSMSLVEDTQTAAAPEIERQDSGSFEMIDLAREALMRGDTASLDAALQQLAITGEHRDLSARLAGVLALTRGAKEEGLRILKTAAQNETQDHQRARALLAYSVALAAAGRHEDALLEALGALALTRAQADKNGELACSRFIAQLSRAAGHEEVARSWEDAARRAAASPP